jgi:hypothetical protein
VFELERHGTTFDPPLILFQLPMQEGASWVNTYSIGVTKFKEVRTFRGSERVKVPAGTFDTLRIDVTETMNDTSTSTPYWYAPHVGIVKESDYLLLSFTPSSK